MQATTGATSTTKRRVYSTNPWAYDEHSTRNCIYCKADKLAFLIYCDKNDLTHGGKLYFFNYVVRVPVLIAPCKDCPDFNNLWDAP